MLDLTLLIQSISAINMVRVSVMFVCLFFFSPENEIEKGKGKINFY